MRAWIATLILAGCAPASAEPKQAAAPPGEIVTADILQEYFGTWGADPGDRKSVV